MSRTRPDRQLPRPQSTPEPAVPKAGGVDEATRFVGEGVTVPRQGAGLYQLLVESITDYAIFVLDPTGHIMTWNPGAQRAKGYAAEEILGRHFSTFYTAEDQAAGKPAWELEVAASDGRVEDEGWRVRKDGTLFWANVVITALRDKSGTLVGFAKVTRDLSERRRAEEALRVSEERFRLLVQSVKDYGIFMLDPGGRIASWNEGAERISGYTADEIIGKHFSIFYPPHDVAADKPAHELVKAAAEGSFEDEGWRVRKDGSLYWSNVVITAVRDSDGDLFGFVKVTRDLSERRAAEQRALDDARRVAEAESANRAKSQFLAAMSHELRTPLNAIGGYAQLMESGVGGTPSDQQRDYLARIRTAQQHLLAIINDLLNYSRIEAGQLTYEMGPVELDEAIGAVIALVEPQARAKSLTLAQVHCEGDPVAWADRAKVDLVVLNLLSNAVKFTPAGGSVFLSCGRTGEQAFVEVSDTGPGVPEELRQVIFDPFVQVGRSLTSVQEGTGLGLAISRDLARAMGGDITVAGAPGGGAVFTFRLPIATRR
ncbi:MAG: sensor histidine kinase [Gemmatimonadaceae bacterium]